MELIFKIYVIECNSIEYVEHADKSIFPSLPQWPQLSVVARQRVEGACKLVQSLEIPPRVVSQENVITLKHSCMGKSHIEYEAKLCLKWLGLEPQKF